MDKIEEKVADFFEMADETCNDAFERMVFLQSVAEAVGVFFWNNYDKAGHEEMAELFREHILKCAKETGQTMQHFHFTIEIDTKK